MGSVRSQYPDAVLDERDPPALVCRLYARRPLEHAEAQVLAYVAAGLTDGEIGRELGISVGKVRWAIRSAISNLGAINRPHAVSRAIAMGYLVLERVGPEDGPQGAPG